MKEEEVKKKENEEAEGEGWGGWGELQWERCVFCSSKTLG